MKTFVASSLFVVVLAGLSAAWPSQVEPETYFALPEERAGFNHSLVLPSICGSMIPGHHGLPAQNTTSPFKGTVDKKSVAEGGVVTVTISGPDSYQGIYLEARDSTQTPVGTFQRNDDSFTSLVNCAPGTNNAWFYLNPNGTKTASAKWTAPAKAGAVTFRFTLAQSYSVFWVGEETSSVQVQ